MMEWTTDKPTTPGWYWWRRTASSGELLLDVVEVRRSVRAGMEASEPWCVVKWCSVEKMPGEWQGPLVPTERTEV